MIRDLLVHVDGSEAGRRRTQLAFDLAARAGARVTGLHVTPAAEIGPHYKPSMVAQAMQEAAARLTLDAHAAGSVFKDEASRRSADASWLEASGDIVQGIGEKARYADMVVLGQYEWQGATEAHPLPIAHSVVLQCGRPVLVVPAAFVSRPLARIVVAWDASREAVRAVHDALPLLRLSQSVRIVTVVDESGQGRNTDADNLSRHLSHHGIAVEANVAAIRSADENAALFEQLQQERYDLIVMGGYSRPQWVELMFGGATQSMLLTAKIPVLVSH
jgi:nucleotide-binding universal stress UspA family protein